jgi:RNA polymerase sigma-70 factor (ECF subfamily)
VRYHNRQKRGLDQERYLDAIADLGGSDATPDEVAAFREVEEMIGGFSQEEQQIIHLRLESYTNQEIAKQLQCSERTVRRLMSRIRERFKQEVGLELGDC